MVNLPNNIILLTIDCLRADKLGCLGNARHITPNIDLLAKDGTMFTQAFSNGPITSFSFPSILTSSYALMYPPVKFRNDELYRVYMPGIYGGVTLAEMLKGQGFYTIGIHSNPWLSSYYNYNRGFDEFIEMMDSIPVAGHCILSKARQFLPTISGKIDFYHSAEITKRAIDLMKNAPQKRCFLWVHYMDPHYPYLAHSFRKNLSIYLRTFPKIRDRVDPVLVRSFFTDTAEYLNASPNVYHRTKLQEELYNGAIMYVDRIVGRFLKGLEQMGIAADENTIILAADHGEEFGEHEDTGHGMKLYDELLHVPLIIAGPSIEKGRIVHSQIQLLDLGPTLCSILGITPPNSFQGQSILATCQGGIGTPVISEYAKKNEQAFSYRDGNWKFILTVRNETMNRELYDLKKDRKETTDVYVKNKGMTTIYERCLLKHIEEEGITRRKYDLIRRIEQIKHANIRTTGHS